MQDYNIVNTLKVIDIYINPNKPCSIDQYFERANTQPEYIDNGDLLEHLYSFLDVLEEISEEGAEQPTEEEMRDINKIAKMQRDSGAGYVRFVRM